MKNFKYILSLFLIITAFIGCEKDDDLPDVSALPAPTNVAAVVTITQDNSGVVTITPTGENVAKYRVNYGDDSGTDSGELNPGESTQHTYAEGTYEIVIAASGINGKTTTVAQTIVVSFQAPENLLVTIENDLGVSRQVNVIATADFAISYDVDFGDPTGTVITNTIGETTSFVYDAAGVYTITVTASSGAIETISYTEDFEVTEILAPLVAAPTAPARQPEDVISIYSGAYANIAGTDFYPNWGQQTTFEEVDVAGDLAIKYGNLNYQGIQYGEEVDASEMEMLHIDIWTPDATQVEIYPISIASGEQQVTKLLESNQWNSFDIPLSDFTDQGLSINDLHQFKFVGSGTLFLDNIYFYKEPAVSTLPSLPVDFESSSLVYEWTGFGDASFGSIPASVVSNPDASGINTSANVVQIEKTAGAQVWAGASMDLDGAVDFTNGTTMYMKVWSPVAGSTIRFKMEDSNSTPDANGNPTVVVEVDAVSTVTNAWEVLAFDLTTWAGFTTTASYDRVVIFPNFNTGGNGEIFYFDDIQLTNTANNNQIPVNFENSNLTYTWTGFGDAGFGPIPAAVTTNPDASGINTSANVLELIKTAGAQVWAGASMDLDGAVDFSNGTTVKMKVWSSTAGATFRFKLEDSSSTPDANGNPTIVVEVDAVSTVTNGWEELTFDLTTGAGFSASESYDTIVIFPNFGANGNDDAYYFDDIMLTN
ncbi:hypothetical protein [uncultured Olleya sp.]|uniref:hypothetical protein n=1 Tax=uncultured Olleya sp. TaxID=757243 RepID=UPI002592CF4A|nr:hypothetical protein [uncultured Olleya sp.]